MALKSAQVEDILILYPEGILKGTDETDALKRRVGEAEAAGSQKLILNMAEVTYMNSVAIGAFIGFLKRSRERGARLALCNLDQHIHAVFVIVKLTLVFDVYQSEAEAIASFAELPAGR